MHPNPKKCGKMDQWISRADVSIGKVYAAASLLMPEPEDTLMELQWFSGSQEQGGQDVEAEW